MSDSVLRIDIDGVLRTRAAKLRRFMPRFVVKWLERLICQEKLNLMLEKSGHLKDADFCRAVLEYLNITRIIKGAENLPQDASGWRAIFVCNHPLGGLDGMALIDYLSKKSPTGRVRFVVNDLLMAIEPLRGVFLPVNKHGGQSRDAAEALEDAMSGDDPVIVFPAGLVSRLQEGEIKDLDWNKMFVNKAQTYQRDVIPMHFSGCNSRFFYKFANLRKRLRIPFNLEMVLLPREVFGNENSIFEITIGERIPHDTLEGGRQGWATAQKIKETVYKLRE